MLGTRICVSADVAELRPKASVAGRSATRSCAARAKALRAFEPLSEEVYAHPATASYAEAFAKIEKGDPGATTAFAALMGMRANDGLVNFHLKRLLNGGSGTVFDLG